MNQSLEKLFRLQNIDREILDKETMVEEIPRKEKEFDKQLKGRKEIFEEVKQREQENHNKELAADKKLQETRMIISRHKQQLLSVKTNKEYAALLREVSTEESNIERLEEEMIILLDEAKEIEDEKKEEERTLSKMEDIYERNKRELEDKKEMYQKTIQEKKIEREKAAADLDSDLIKRYERIRSSRDGIAVVRIQGGNCGGCFSAIPPQVINEAKKGNKILTCESCGRIFVYIEEGEGIGGE